MVDVLMEIARRKQAEQNDLRASNEKSMANALQMINANANRAQDERQFQAKLAADPEAQLNRYLFGGGQPQQRGIGNDLSGNILVDRQNAPSGGVVPIESSGGAGINRDQLMRGMLSKKFGIPYEQMMTPEERGRSVEERKFQMEKGEKDKQLEVRSNFVKESALGSLKTIGEVEKGINYFGAVGKVPTLNPWGYERKNWEANVNKLLSGKIIELMTTMKEASKTGATGFGQLSNKELAVLRDSATALNKGLSPTDAQGYLNDMKVILNKVAGESPQESSGKTYVKTGMYNGKKVGQLPDGTIEEIQ
jgi:hypothetical protein